MNSKKISTVHTNLWVLYSATSKGFVELMDSNVNPIGFTQNLKDAELFKTRSLAEQFSNNMKKSFNLTVNPLKLNCKL